MTPREQRLAIALFGAVLLTVSGAVGYMFIWQPLLRQQAAEAALTQEIAELDAKLAAQNKKAKEMEVARARSLPADEELARRAYPVVLGHLAEAAGVPKGFTITPKSDNSNRAVPEISKGKPAYTRIAYELAFRKADMWAIKDFLEGYYRLGLLQQITSLTIKKDEDPSAKNSGRRNDLTVILTTEAILVDGAESRRTLLPIPTAFAAVGGGGIFKGMGASKNLEAGQGIKPTVLVPILSTQPRDYSLIVRKDPFNGPLPLEDRAPFKVAKIDNVKIKTEEPPSPVKVVLSGEGSVGATVSARTEGTLFPEGELKVDPKTHAIALPSTSATEGSSTVHVTAASAYGKIENLSFQVSVTYKPEIVSPGEDISAFIVLIGVTQAEGKAWARIVDNANRLRYQIDATPSGIKVAKEGKWPQKGVLVWVPWDDHKNQPPGVMVISAPESKTHRTFQVIAVDGEGLIVADLKPEGHATAPPPPGKWPGGGGGRPGGGGWPPAPPKQGPGNPLAAMGGNMIVNAPSPKYYRWGIGKSLSGITLLTDSEAKKVLKQAQATGPVFDVAAAGR